MKTKILLLTKRLAVNFIYLLIASWVIISFYFLLDTGFTKDDTWNSLVRGQIIEEDISLFKRIYNEVNGWFFGAGSIRLLYYCFIYTFYYFTPELLTVKLFTVSTLVLNALLFFNLINKLTNSIQYSFVTCLIFISIIQLRVGDDPVLGYPSYIAMLVMCIYLYSYSCFIEYLNSGDISLKKKSEIFFLVGCLFYELLVPYFITYFVIAYLFKNKFELAFKDSKNFIKISLIIIFLTTFIKLIYLPYIKGTVSTYPILNYHLDLFVFLKAFYIQFAAAFPLNVYLFNNEGVTNNLLNLSILLIVFSFIFFLVLVIVRKNNYPFNLKKLFFIGFLLSIIPAGLVAISGHQNELIDNGMGSAYFPVFMQYFGIAILISLIIFVLIKNIFLKVIIIIPLSIIFYIGSYLNIETNKDIAQLTNTETHYARNLVESAIHAGIFDEIDGEPKRRDYSSFIFRIDNKPSDSYRMYATYTDKLFTTCQMLEIDQKAIDATENSIDCLSLINEKNYMVIYKKNNKEIYVNNDSNKIYGITYNVDLKNGKKGRLILGQVDEITFNTRKNKIEKIILKSNKIYNLEKNSITASNEQIDLIYFNKYHGQNFDDVQYLYNNL